MTSPVFKARGDRCKEDGAPSEVLKPVIMQIADVSSCIWSCAVRQKFTDVSEYLLLAGYFLGLLSDTEDGADIFFRIVQPGFSTLTNHLSL